MASSALDIITGALLNINAVAAGEQVSAYDQTLCLNLLNDLLDSLSNDEAFVYTQSVYTFPYVAGQYQYTIGNPVGGTFTGNVTNGSVAITGATVPSALILLGTLTDTAGLIPASTTVSQIGVPITFSGAPTGVSATLSASVFPSGWPYVTGPETLVFSDGEVRSATFTNGSAAVTWTGALTGSPTAANNNVTSVVLMSAAATGTSVGGDTITYTVPGNIPIARPLRFRSGFTRALSSGTGTNNDYAFDWVSLDRYKEELLKNVQGPWPYIAAYQPTFPYGTVFFYPAPGAAYSCWIYYDLILAEYPNVTAAYSLPQGYTRALKKLLALEASTVYGKTVSAELRLQAKEAKDLLKGTNSSPVVTLKFDSAISRAQQNDASWAQNGGFT